MCGTSPFYNYQILEDLAVRSGHEIWQFRSGSSDMAVRSGSSDLAMLGGLPRVNDEADAKRPLSDAVSDSPHFERARGAS